MKKDLENWKCIENPLYLCQESREVQVIEDPGTPKEIDIIWIKPISFEAEIEQS